MRYSLNNSSFEDLNPQNQIVFFQIPKTGGLAYTQALSYIYQDSYLYVDDPPHLNYLLGKNLTNKRVFAGNFNLNHKFYDRVNNFVHITLLKEPVSRIVCMYDNILKNPEHSSYEIVANNSLTYIVRNNLISSTFGWCDLMGYVSSMESRGNRPCNILQQAKFNLDNFFTFYGLAEEFEEFIEISRINLKWPEHLEYTGYNSIDEMVDLSSIDDSTWHFISEAIEHDKKFYDYAKSRYKDQRDLWLGIRPKVFDMQAEETKVEEPKIEVFRDKTLPIVAEPIFVEEKSNILKRIWSWLTRQH